MFIVSWVFTHAPFVDGITLASFQTAGTSPDCQNLWHIAERGPAVTNSYQYSGFNPVRPHGLTDIHLIQLLCYHFGDDKWKVTAPLIIVLHL